MTIKVRITPRHLEQYFGLFGVPVSNINRWDYEKEYHGDTTVWQCYHDFQNCIDDTDDKKKDIDTLLKNMETAFNQTARSDYDTPWFSSIVENQKAWLAAHENGNHGVLTFKEDETPTSDSLYNKMLGPKARPVFLLDFAFERSFRAVLKEPGGDKLNAKVECHLCDTLGVVIERASEAEGSVNRSNGSAVLELRVELGSFVEYTKRRLANRESMKPIIWNRGVAEAASRNGLGMPMLTHVLPWDLWTHFNESVKDIFLRAAQHVASHYETVVLDPRLHSGRNLRNSLSERVVVGPMSNMDATMKKSVPGLRAQFDRIVNEARGGKNNFNSLIQRAVQNRMTAVEGNPTSPSAESEIRDALHSDDVIRSVKAQPILELHPLHKRVLGLMEYLIDPELIKKYVGGRAVSGRWSNAFTGWNGENFSKPVVSSLHCVHEEELGRIDKLATFETTGNWLIWAKDKPGPLDLAELLDGIFDRMFSANEVKGLRVTLQPETPEVHAQQLANLVSKEKGKEAACMTLYLGKIVLMLRNTIEHGIDRVADDGLLIETNYWSNNDGQAYKWLTKNVLDSDWPHTESFPNAVPEAAKSFVLTPASLQRCLVLMSLVLHGTIHHLDLDFKNNDWDE